MRVLPPSSVFVQHLNEHLLRHLVQDTAQQTANSTRLARLLEAHDCAGLKELFHAFFASIPYHWYTNNEIADYEGFYASVFYSYFAALGYDVVVEEASSHGRLDMAVRTAGHVYLFEFKVVELAPPGSALAQLQERRYADKYRATGAADPPRRRRVQPRRPQRHHVRRGERLMPRRGYRAGAVPHQAVTAGRQCLSLTPRRYRQYRPH